MRHVIAILALSLSACMSPQELQAIRERHTADANAQIARVIERECMAGTKPVTMHTPRLGYRIEFVRQHSLSRDGRQTTLFFDDMGNLTDTIRYGSTPKQ